MNLKIMFTISSDMAMALFYYSGLCHHYFTVIFSFFPNIPVLKTWGWIYIFLISPSESITIAFLCVWLCVCVYREFFWGEKYGGGVLLRRFTDYYWAHLFPNGSGLSMVVMLLFCSFHSNRYFWSSVHSSFVLCRHSTQFFCTPKHFSNIFERSLKLLLDVEAEAFSDCYVFFGLVSVNGR